MLCLHSNEKQMTTQDQLWKAIIEEFFDDFMHFFFPDFVNQIDTTRPYVEMDKFLLTYRIVFIFKGHVMMVELLNEKSPPLVALLFLDLKIIRLVLLI